MLDSKWISAFAKISPPRGKFSFRAHVPRKRPAPVLIADKPWESMSLSWHTVIHEGGRYRMWYEAWDSDYRNDTDARLCYAESPDLERWEKPNLALVEYKGSKANNIVFHGGMGAGPGFHGHSICFEPPPRHTSTISHEPSSPYHMIYMGGPRPDQRGVFTAHSGDGLRWFPRKEIPPLWYKSDTQTVAFWDPSLKQYVGFFRSWETDTRAHQGKPVRCIARAETDDFDRWPTPATIRAPDEADGPHTDLYNNGACRYESGGDVAYLIFASTFHHDTDTCDVELMTSRDSRSWQRFSRAKIIATGPAAWDAGTVYACPGLVPWRNGWALTYHASSYRHGEAVPSKVRYGAGVGVVEYPMDRFQGLRSEDFEATLASFPLTRKSPRVTINATVGSGGEIRGALMKGGIVLPGCGFDDCTPVTGDTLAGELSWSGAGKLHWLDGPKVELRLLLKKAVLFAIGASLSEEVSTGGGTDAAPWT